MKKKISLTDWDRLEKMRYDISSDIGWMRLGEERETWNLLKVLSALMETQIGQNSQLSGNPSDLSALDLLIKSELNWRPAPKSRLRNN